MESSGHGGSGNRVTGDGNDCGGRQNKKVLRKGTEKTSECNRKEEKKY